MEDIIKKLLTEGKGILANDESTSTIAKRMGAIGVVSTPEINRKYRQMLVTTPGIQNYISGIIFFDETVHQNLDNGKSFIDYVSSLGIVPGVKVDQGLEPYGDHGEKISKESSDLEERLKNYLSLGIKFAKWRAVFNISDITPSAEFIDKNLDRLVDFVEISQKVGIVPVPEPEILMDGLHTTTRCGEVTEDVLKMFFAKMQKRNLNLSSLILKPNMILPGKDNGVNAQPLEVAHATLRILDRSVPKEVPGIVFLSGGQSSDQAIMNLNEITKVKGEVPWQITFSFLRALQDDARVAWAGKDENVAQAQQVFLKRLEMVSKARLGQLGE